MFAVSRPSKPREIHTPLSNVSSVLTHEASNTQWQNYSRVVTSTITTPTQYDHFFRKCAPFPHHMTTFQAESTLGLDPPPIVPTWPDLGSDNAHFVKFWFEFRSDNANFAIFSTKFGPDSALFVQFGCPIVSTLSNVVPNPLSIMPTLLYFGPNSLSIRPTFFEIGPIPFR